MIWHFCSQRWMKETKTFKKELYAELYLIFIKDVPWKSPDTSARGLSVCFTVWSLLIHLTLFVKPPFKILLDFWILLALKKNLIFRGFYEKEKSNYWRLMYEVPSKGEIFISLAVDFLPRFLLQSTLKLKRIFVFQERHFRLELVWWYQIKAINSWL